MGGFQKEEITVILCEGNKRVCQHEWSKDDVKVGNVFTRYCVKCGMTAFDDSLDMDR